MAESDQSEFLNSRGNGLKSRALFFSVAMFTACLAGTPIASAQDPSPAVATPSPSAAVVESSVTGTTTTVVTAPVQAPASKSVPGKSMAASIHAPGPRSTFSSIKTNEPILAMTFDDGPHPVNTPKLLDMLAQRHIKATFFLIGENAERYPELVKRIVAEGHEIGNHSWTHPNLAIMSDDKVRSEVGRTDKLIESIIGKRPLLLRPPYGSLAQAQRRWISNEYNYKIILWSVDPLDWKDPGPAVVAKRILSATGKGSIVLSHDIHAGTVTAMPQVLDALIAKGYKFMTVSELLTHDRPDLKITTSGTTAATAASPKPSPAK